MIRRCGRTTWNQTTGETCVPCRRPIWLPIAVHRGTAMKSWWWCSAAKGATRGHSSSIPGGRNGDGPTRPPLLHPRRNEWRWPKPAHEPDERSGGNMTYDASRKVHVLFGSQFTDDPHTWTYDVRRNEWRDMQPKAQPPTDKNDAVLTYEPIHRVVLAIVKVTSGKDEDAKHELQTWAYDAGSNQWQRMSPTAEPEPSGNRARQLIFAPELNLAILENCTSKPREQQVWTYRYADAPATGPAQSPAKPRRAPAVVEDAVVSVVSPKRIEISWKAPPVEAASVY